MKPFKTLRQILVHPKDKRSIEDTGECVYKIPCQNCESVFIGETGKRLQEHRKDTEIASSSIHTRAERKVSVTEVNKSAITDHVVSDSHVIKWTRAEIMNREGYCMTRQVKESIWIRKQKSCMNRDVGAYDLAHVYDQLLVTRLCVWCVMLWCMFTRFASTNAHWHCSWSHLQFFCMRCSISCRSKTATAYLHSQSQQRRYYYSVWHW